MKKVLLILLLLTGMSFANYAKQLSLTSGFTYTAGEDYIQYEAAGISIATPNTAYIEVKFDNILDWDGIDFTVKSTDGDSITTANIDWLSETDIIYESTTLNSGTPVTTMKSQRAHIKVFNPSSNVVTVATLNIRAWND